MQQHLFTYLFYKLVDNSRRKCTYLHIYISDWAGNLVKQKLFILNWVNLCFSQAEYLFIYSKLVNALIKHDIY